MDVVLALVFLVGLFALFLGLPAALARNTFREKGYAPVGGVFLGLCLGWLGMLIAALLPYKPVGRPAR